MGKESAGILTPHKKKFRTGKRTMPFVSVPKDLTKVKTKVAFNLTKRQLVCFGLGAVTGIPAYLLTRGSIGTDIAALFMIGLMLPFFAFGIYEKDGMPLEKVLGNFISASFIRPHYRPYRTDNGYVALMKQEQGERMSGGKVTVGQDHAGRKEERFEKENMVQGTIRNKKR